MWQSSPRLRAKKGTEGKSRRASLITHSRYLSFFRSSVLMGRSESPVTHLRRTWKFKGQDQHFFFFDWHGDDDKIIIIITEEEREGRLPNTSWSSWWTLLCTFGSEPRRCMTQFMDAAVVSCPCNEDNIPLQPFAPDRRHRRPPTRNMKVSTSSWMSPWLILFPSSSSVLSSMSRNACLFFLPWSESLSDSR